MKERTERHASGRDQGGALREPVIPDDIPEGRFPDLLRNWFLGSRARSYLSRRRYREVTDLVRATPRGRALDAGCGWGYSLFLLARDGMTPVGIDIVQNDFLAAGRIARENGYDALLAGADISALPFAANAFAAVTAVETFEHIFDLDRAGAVREVWRVLSPGGAFALSTPNYHSIVETGKRVIVRLPFLMRAFPTMCYPAGEMSREMYHPYRYHKPAPRGEIVRMLETAGFRVERVKTVVFVWKNVPDSLFPIARFFESILERMPLVKELGSTIVLLARKPMRARGENGAHGGGAG